MSFTPLARVKNFTVANLKEFLDLYPDLLSDISWENAANLLEDIKPRYKRSYYQLACQMGLEDRSNLQKFQYHKYLQMFSDEDLRKYMEFWFKIYYAPNPYVKQSDQSDPPVLLFCTFAEKLLQTTSLEIDFNKTHEIICGEGGSLDIEFNCFKNYGTPIKCKTSDNKNILYISESDREKLRMLVEFIKKEFPVKNHNDLKAFYDRFSYKNYIKFWKIEDEHYDEGGEWVIQQRIDSYMRTDSREKGGENVILYGVPGSGKSYKIKMEYCKDPHYMERIVFHPDYTYSDFIGQILPKVENEKVRYEFIPGPFTKIMAKAWNDPAHKYYLVIEELNRGNAPAIFGDIFQLLDRNPDGWGTYSIYNADMSHVIFSQEEEISIKIPSNLSIIATMNTSDQNVFTLDNAFQRRWKMRLIHNSFKKNGQEQHDLHLDHKIAGTEIKWGTFAELINSQIAKTGKESLGAEDKRLGVFFVRNEELNDREAFAEKVLKYLWDDAFKMNREEVFRDEYNSFEDVVDAFLCEDDSADPLQCVLTTNIYSGMDPKQNL